MINRMHGAGDRGVIDVLVRLQFPHRLLRRGKLGCALISIAFFEGEALVRFVCFLPFVVCLEQAGAKALGCRAAAYRRGGC